MNRWIFLFCAAFLVGCAADTTIPDMSAESLYAKAHKLFSKTDYEGAAKYFDEVERQHPYSQWAPRAQIMAAYSFYEGEKYDDAILALDRFIQLHPGNKNAPYAYYLRGLCYYEQISDVAREQQMTVNAKRAFNDVITRFPNSIYANDAQTKLNTIEDQLAGKEMAVGRYYLEQKEYMAALRRFDDVVQRFSHTNQVNEAYYRIAVCYTVLGMLEQAQKLAELQKRMYPTTEWTLKTGTLVKKYQPKEKVKK